MHFIIKIISKSNIQFFLFSALLMWQYGQYPGRRFPNLDYSWADAINISRVSDIQKSLKNFEIPEMNFFVGLGLEKLSEVAGYVNPINPLHFLLYFSIKPEQFILIKTCIFLSILQIGTYMLVYQLTTQKKLATLTAFIGATLPAYWSIMYPFTTLFCLICSLPMFLFIYLKYLESNKIRYLVVYFLLITAIGPDLLTTGNIVIFNLASVWFIKKLKQFLSFSLTGAVATMSFWYPYLHLTQNRKERLTNLGIISEGEFNFLEYWKMILTNGAHTILYPIEGSAIQMYTPVFCLVSITGYLLLNLFSKDREFNQRTEFQNRLLLFTLTISILPSLLYIHPLTSKYLFSYYRNNFNLIPILLLIATSLIFSQIKKRRFLIVLICSIGIEITLFLLDPITRFQNIIPNGESIARAIGTSEGLFTSNLEGTLLVKTPFISNLPWLNLMVVNLVLAILLFYSTNNREIFWQGKLFYIVSIIFVFYSFSTNIELRKYMTAWQQVSVSDYRFTNYEQRTTKWVNQYQINEANYRVLLTSKEFYRNSGRNVKLLLDAELNTKKNIKVIPAYRELDNVDMNLSLFKLTCPNCEYKHGEFLTQYWPPTVEQILANREWLKENSVKYVISADQEINSVDFVLLDSFKYQLTNYGYDETENGIVYLYMYKHPKPIIDLQNENQRLINLAITTKGISFDYSSSVENELKVNYYYTEGYKAKLNGHLIVISKSEDNRLILNLPAGNGKVEILYSDSKLRQSSILSLAVLILVLGSYFRSKKLKKIF